MDLRLNVPPQPQGAALPERTRAALASVAAREDLLDLLSYGASAGAEADRAAGAAWLRPRLGNLAVQDVAICAGGASLLAALATTFARPGDTIVTEALTYPGIRAVSRHFGFSLFGIAMDGEGILPAALAAFCERVRPKILYCTPTIQNPTTATMSMERRVQIVEVARQFDLVIIEDDAYGMLPTDAPPPLASIAPERTYYLASLSKCLSPGLRVAYCVGPEEGRVRMIEGIRVMTLHAPPVMAAMATQWIEDGSASEILEAIRAECTARQDLARGILDGEVIAAHPQGPHLWISLPGEWNIPELGIHLRGQGVAAKGDGFAVDGVHPNALRVSLGAPRETADLARALERLATTLREQSWRIG